MTNLYHAGWEKWGDVLHSEQCMCNLSDDQDAVGLHMKGLFWAKQSAARFAYGVECRQPSRHMWQCILSMMQANTGICLSMYQAFRQQHDGSCKRQPHALGLSKLECHVSTYEQMWAGFGQCGALGQLPEPPQLGPAMALLVSRAVPLQQGTCCQQRAHTMNLAVMLLLHPLVSCSNLTKLQ